MTKLIYLDNAATTHPKPETVYSGVDKALRELGSSGRGAHKLALDASRAIFDVRISVGEFLGVSSERIVFTPGCTHSINYVLKGFSFAPGDVVVVSALEHNAVMRPLHQMERQVGIKVLALPYTPGDIVSRADLKDVLSGEAKLCVMCEGSNVTGELLDIEMVASECNRYWCAALGRRGSDRRYSKVCVFA